MKPIYEPKTRAKEYGDLAINIYQGCTHGCVYCYAPLVLHRDKESFHKEAYARSLIVEAVKTQLAKEKITGKTIHLCFTCDPYPAFTDTEPTRLIIEAIKNAGNHVQILTKGGMRAVRDFDLLDKEDSFGVTVTAAVSKTAEIEPNAAGVADRLTSLKHAHRMGIKTWISFEPVYDPYVVYRGIEQADYIDLYKIGKLNYFPSDIDWGQFGRECERLCQKFGRNYYIKEDLRKEMEAANE
jgi:DNA repair photolyase